MKIVCISDTHCQHDQVIVPECDLLLHTGDATIRGSEKEFEDYVHWLEKQPAKHIAVIAGNHDFVCQTNPTYVHEFYRESRVNYLYDSYVDIEGLKVYGSPWQPWFHDWAFNFDKYDDGTQAIACWEKIPNDADIVLTHGPPYRILDRVRRWRPGEDPDVGCPYLLERLKVVKPKLHVFGHIHEQYGIQVVGETKFVNASTCTLQYEPTNEPIIIELEV
jgi:Icc-related predicted phosphoesterase